MIVIDDMASVVMPDADLRSRACVYFKDQQGQLRPCEFSIDQILETGVQRHSTCISNSGVAIAKPSKRKCISIDDANSTNSKRRKQEEEIVIEFPWDPKVLTSIVLQSRDRMLLGRQVLMMALDRRRSISSLKKVFAMKGLPMWNCTIRENPYLCPGHSLYDNFIESLLEFFKLENGSDTGTPNLALFGQFLESSADKAEGEIFTTVERGGIRTAFHGTNHDVMDAILKSGLDPARRTLHLSEDYFGLTYMTSLSYTFLRTKPTPTSPKLLVFLVINATIPTHWRDTVATVKFNKFQLPVAEIELLNYDRQVCSIFQ